MLINMNEAQSMTMAALMIAKKGPVRIESGDGLTASPTARMITFQDGSRATVGIYGLVNWLNSAESGFDV